MFCHSLMWWAKVLSPPEGQYSVPCWPPVRVVCRGPGDGEARERPGGEHRRRPGGGAPAHDPHRRPARYGVLALGRRQHLCPPHQGVAKHGHHREGGLAVPGGQEDQQAQAAAWIRPAGRQDRPGAGEAQQHQADRRRHPQLLERLRGAVALQRVPTEHSPDCAR